MRGERRLLRLGEYLVGRACQQLPPDVREERYREWAAELPAILCDPQVRLAPRRAVRMLGYPVDTLRGTIMTPGRARAGSTECWPGCPWYAWLLAWARWAWPPGPSCRPAPAAAMPHPLIRGPSPSEVDQRV